jgi:hypothetical protein
MVPALCAQFGWALFDGPFHAAFAELPNEVRYSINIMAEAIVATWTDWPLPGNVSHERSRALSEILGWCPEQSGFSHDFLPGGSKSFGAPNPEQVAKSLGALPKTVRHRFERWVELESIKQPRRLWRRVNCAYAKSRGVDILQINP